MSEETTTTIEEPTVETVLDAVTDGEKAPPVNPLADDVKQPVGDAPPESWLPEDLREHERLKAFESPEALARAYAQANLAQELPETYQLPEGIPAKLGEWAKEQKLTQGQLDSMIQFKTGLDQYDQGMRSRVYTEGRKQLFNQWGEQKDANLATAEGVFRSVPSGPKLAQLLKASGEGANPVVIQFLHEVGGFMKEGGYLKNPNVSAKTKTDPLRQRYPTMFKDDSEE
jgi:hypothetical protein